MRVRVTYREPIDPVPPLERRSVATGHDGPSRSRPGAGVLAAAALGWLVAFGLVLWHWVLHQPTQGEVLAVLGLKLAVFAFVVIGVPLVRLSWSHHGGRFRRDR